jgi:hypothetical protein
MNSLVVPQVTDGKNVILEESFFNPAFSPNREFIRQATLPCHPEAILFKLEPGA